MFPSLRAKLIVAFALVTFVTVLLTALGTMLLLRQREVTAARERVGQFGNAVAEQVMWRASANWQPDALANFLQQRADELHLRFLLIDAKDTIVTDTAGQLTGRPARDLSLDSAKFDRSNVTGFSFTTWQGQLVFIPSAGPVIRSVRQDYRVLMLVPEGDIAGAWHGLFPRLAISGGAALAAAIVVAYLLSRSISRPVAVVTRAAEEMARGNYDQRIPVQGNDEIGRLAVTFNGMARQVSRTHQTMKDLIGNVAHELKTPLTSIQGYSQALLDGMVATPEEREHAARIINDEADRMRRLVEDLLYLSRLESGQLQIAREPVRVPVLLETAAERLRWKLHGSDRTLSLHLPVDLPTLQGDESRLQQALANLLDNAERFTPAGGAITLSAEWLPEGVAIRVHNTGSYIPPEHLERVFERFYQVDASRTRDGHHGGLGLSIAREIVQAHGGTLAAASDPEGGTEFRILLPVARTRPVDDAAWRPPAPSSTPTTVGAV